VTYKGKVDWWIGLSIVVGIGVPLIAALLRHQWPALTLSVLFAGLVLIALYPQSCETTPDALRIRHGLLTDTIPWASITRVSTSSDSGSSLAMSLDRVVIECAGGTIQIAPEDQARFFDDVAAHCPQLSKRGMDLVIALN